LIQFTVAEGSLWPLPGFGQLGGAVIALTGMVMMRSGSQTGERIVRQVLAEADLHVLEGAVILLAHGDGGRRGLDAEAFQLLDDRVIVGPPAPTLLAGLLDGGF
jgi:hypothetical protein